MKDSQAKANRSNITYNAKTCDYSDITWCKERGLSIRAFDNYDGGGWCCYIVEFKTLEDLKVFVTERKISSRCWIEHTDGKIEDLQL
jgi:ribosomal protein S18